MVYGERPYVHSNQYGRFLVFEDELRERGYSQWEYAHTIVRILKKWADKKGFRTIPVNVFTGDWALRRFQVVAGSEYVCIAGKDLKEELYWNELTVATTYVVDNISDGTVVTLSRVVAGLKPLLSDSWLNRYYNDKDRPVIKVLDELCEEYGIVFAKNYADLVRQIRGRRDISIQ